MKKISKIDIAYIAGFFDGEGCFSTSTPQNNYSPRITVGQKYSNILYWIQDTLDMGNIHKTSKGLFTLRIFGKSNIMRFTKLVFPYLKVKKSQSMVVLDLCKLKSTDGISITTKNFNTRIKLAKKLKELKRKDCVF